MPSQQGPWGAPPGGASPAAGSPPAAGPLPTGGPAGASDPFGAQHVAAPHGAAPHGSAPAGLPQVPTSTDSLAAATPPTWLLFLAGALALVAGIVALIVANPIVAIICWLIAGPVAIGLLAWFVIKDTFARSSGLYAAPGWVKPLHTVAIVVSLICILAPAWRIADWVGHL